MGFILSGMFLRDSILYWSFLFFVAIYLLLKIPLQILTWVKRRSVLTAGLSCPSTRLWELSLNSVTAVFNIPAGWLAFYKWMMLLHIFSENPTRVSYSVLTMSKKALIMCLHPPVSLFLISFRLAFNRGSQWWWFLPVTLNPPANTIDKCLQKVWIDSTHPFSECMRREEIYS